MEKKLKTVIEGLQQGGSAPSSFNDFEKKQWNQRSYKGLYSRRDNIFDFLSLVSSWKSIVGELLSKHTSPLKIQRNTLFISTEHSIFSQELSFMTTELIHKIEKAFPSLKGTIKKIKFVSMTIEQKQKHQEKQHQYSQKMKQKLHRFSPEYLKLQKKSSDLFGEIEDPEIKDIFKDLFFDKHTKE